MVYVLALYVPAAAAAAAVGIHCIGGKVEGEK